MNAKAITKNAFSLPFKGRAGVGMGYGRSKSLEIPTRLNPIPLLTSPLKGEE
jgi:hypothetical protein